MSAKYIMPTFTLREARTLRTLLRITERDGAASPFGDGDKITCKADMENCRRMCEHLNGFLAEDDRVQARKQAQREGNT